MAPHLHPDLKGKIPTAAHVAANKALLAKLMPADKTTLNDAEAFDILHAWLQPNMPESNRWIFGEYVKLWLRRRGKTLENSRSIHSIPRQSLYDVLVGTFPDSPDLSHIKLGLGSSTKIIHNFWAQPERLRLTLKFMDVSAVWALQELAIVTDLTLKPPVTPEVLDLLDGFWRQGRHKWGGNSTKLKRFGDWVKMQFLAQPGQSRQLALKMGPAACWSTVRNQRGNCPAQFSLSLLLSGRAGNWSLPKLEALAGFVTHTTGENYTPERLVAEYTTWCATQNEAA